jgi:hypothetical protein
LQGLVIFTADLRIWSGGVKLTREEDLSTVKHELPPIALVTDGRKYLVKPAVLAPFHAIRKRLERLLSKRGFRLMADGFAVPESESEQTIAEIDALEREFADLVPEFLSKLPSYYEELIGEYPAWRDVLERGRLSDATVASRLKFAVGVYKITSPDPDNVHSPLNRQYTNVINGAVPALLNDVAEKAQALLKGPIGQRVCVTQAQHSSVRRLVERLNAFAFLDYRVGPAADALMGMLGCVPQTGPLSAGNSAVLKIVVESLSDPDTVLQEYAQGELDEETDASAPAPVTAVPAPAASTPTFVGI